MNVSVGILRPLFFMALSLAQLPANFVPAALAASCYRLEDLETAMDQPRRHVAGWQQGMSAEGDG